MAFGTDLWKIVLESNCSEETERDIKIGLDDLYAKARAFDELKKHVDEEVDSYMALYRQTKDPIYSLLNSHYDTLLGFIEELERADDD